MGRGYGECGLCAVGALLAKEQPKALRECEPCWEAAARTLDVDTYWLWIVYIAISDVTYGIKVSSQANAVARRLREFGFRLFKTA